MSNAPCARPDGNGQGVMLPAAESRVGGQGPRQFSSGEFRWYSKAGGILSGRETHNETIRRLRGVWAGCGVAAACAVLKEDWLS
jgi:hypothetical protein